ncbi:hypothetical protein [Streptomyces sp. NPDC048106]|uniref:hypothetical protein n=1 Tax=Streptomyces sp. NPDC048106 TaxID=3155750 RepID=UPI0034564188
MRLSPFEFLPTPRERQLRTSNLTRSTRMNSGLNTLSIPLRGDTRRPLATIAHVLAAPPPAPYKIPTS